METTVRELFDRYERAFASALSGKVDMDQVAAFYAAEFIAASPAGVMTGKNDEQLKQVMSQGYAHYRDIGTKAMRVLGLRVSPLDERHCVAHVSWRATYARPGEADVEIDFENHYFVQELGDEAKIFGWVTGDEQALQKEHGIG